MGLAWYCSLRELRWLWSLPAWNLYYFQQLSEHCFLLNCYEDKFCICQFTVWLDCAILSQRSASFDNIEGSLCCCPAESCLVCPVFILTDSVSRALFLSMRSSCYNSNAFSVAYKPSMVMCICISQFRTSCMRVSVFLCLIMRQFQVLQSHIAVYFLSALRGLHEVDRLRIRCEAFSALNNCPEDVS